MVFRTCTLNIITDTFRLKTTTLLAVFLMCSLMFTYSLFLYPSFYMLLDYFFIPSFFIIGLLLPPPKISSWFIGKDPDAGRDWGQEEKGTTEDEMAGWHHWLNAHWVWVNSGSWWWTGRTGMLWFMGSQRVGHNWVTELNWKFLVVAPELTIYNLQSTFK